MVKMDKFAIDLDQVLNDFEYSELTDQYHSSRNQEGHTSTSSNNSNGKHSINNVFHSLNEYLNTNIDVADVSQIENTSKKSTCNNSISEPDNVKSIDDSSESTVGGSSKNEEICNSDRNETIIASFILDEVEKLKVSSCEIEKETVDISSKIENDNYDDHKKKANSVEKNNSEDIVQFSNLIEVSNESTEVKESPESNVQPSSLIEIFNENAIDIRETQNENIIIAQKENSDVHFDVENIEESSRVGFKDELNLSDSDINTLLAEFEIELAVTEGDINNRLTTENVSIIDNSEIPLNNLKIPQGDIIHSNEPEVLKMDLEFPKNDEEIHSYQRNVERNSPTTLNNDEEVLKDDHKDNPIMLENHSKTCERTLEKNEDSHEVHEKYLDTESGHSIENVTVCENKLTSGDDMVEYKDAKDCKNNEFLERENISDIKSDEKTQVTNKEQESLPVVIKTEIETNSKCSPDSEETEIQVDKNSGDDEAVHKECENEEAKTESANLAEGDTGISSIGSLSGENDENEVKNGESLDSSCRPKNLSLIGADGDLQREINLIGGPGSTPYNNVYVNEEIQKISMVDSDTDCSTSASNTFSDASSIASTASTEEMKDDNQMVENVISTTIDNSVTSIESPQVNSSDTGENSTPGPISTEETVDANKTENETGENSEFPTESTENCDLMDTQAPEPTPEVNLSGLCGERQWLGKEAPLWIPDSDTTSCLHCDMKFTVLKRRHHCRACGLVLCSKCCYLRFKLEYLDAEARVCNKCHNILNTDTNTSSSSDVSPESGNSPHHRPNPNNPLEYCSTISPLEQVGSSSTNPPAIMVPVGVLKRKGSNKAKSNKSVMFCDGIRPGSDLTNLDNDFNYNNTKTKKLEKNNSSIGKVNINLPIIDSETNTFIPKSENSLPPLVTRCKTDITYTDCSNNSATVDMLKQGQHTFAVHLSLYVHAKIIDMSCCINKMAWCFCTEGMINVGQDEIVILLEYIDEESFVPKDIFYHINNIYTDAVKGSSVKELGLSLHNSTNFLDSKNHAGFVYIRPTFQCVENIIKPKDPYLIGILIHRWETPWAKLFPLRLILRLGAEYRYYPSPIISTRHRDSVFVEIGHTIINLLADFRNFSYTLPQIRGLTIHMEDKNTTVTIPVNRYDQVIKSLNNTSDHILAFAGVFSQQADSHLVCIQDTQGNENCYSTHAINIHNKPRKVTGASFIVFNGALKSSSGLTAKSNIVEDGLMIQVPPEHMQQIRDKLRAMKDHTIACGCINADSDETINIVWGENDVNFNVGVTSAIDGMSLSGIPSIRVHNGKNHVCVNGNRIIRWTEVFIIQNGEDSPKNQDPIDVSRLSESIAKATCDALVKYLDLLLTNNCQKLGIRVTLQEDNVSYFAGSNGTKLPPIYMKSLDDELIPVLHRITSNDLRENSIVLELIFRILNV
ncbi:zinc finger FYVE domain-containing protein 9-like [Leptinotarsa decemlineata]|uniref:zinc finger FYVE domain-containing protein 9-like n=1 Tax=Leptinotarsa decemlineata TaxID=7539 RepID=UPI003D3046FA